MKKVSAFLILLLLSVSSVSFASSETKSETIPPIVNNNLERKIALANSSGIRVDFTNNLTETDLSPVNSEESITVPAAGIIFAAFLFGVGSLVRRKKKVKANDIVGAFARPN